MKVLVIENNERKKENIIKLLEQNKIQDYETEKFTRMTIRKFFKIGKNNKMYPDLIITSLELPEFESTATKIFEKAGLFMLYELADFDYKIPTIIYSANELNNEEIKELEDLEYPYIGQAKDSKELEEILKKYLLSKKNTNIEEWLKRIRLAKYKSLCTTKTNEIDPTLTYEIEEFLLESGYTKEQLQKEVKDYAYNQLPKINEVLQVKADEILHDLLVALDVQENNKTLNTHQYPEYYYRIQEIVAMDETIGSEILDQAIEKANIEYNVFNNIDESGNDLAGYTYYFYKR